MFKQVIIPFIMNDLVLAGELMFFAIFACSFFWVYRKGSTEFYERLASLPNDDIGERQ